jgi:hypothetical protein
MTKDREKLIKKEALLAKVYPHHEPEYQKAYQIGFDEGVATVYRVLEKEKGKSMQKEEKETPKEPEEWKEKLEEFALINEMYIRGFPMGKLEQFISTLLSQKDKEEWNPYKAPDFKSPKINEPVLLAIQGFESGKILYAVGKKVKEDDVDWRICDGDSEISNAWVVIAWQPIKDVPEEYKFKH